MITSPRTIKPDRQESSAPTVGGVTVRVGLKPHATADEKIAFLLAEVEHQNSDLAILKKDTHRQHEDLKALLAAEEAKRASDVREVRKLLTSHATGGLDLSFCGAIFLLFGVVLGTLPYAWFTLLG
jgi:hypothetical protein